jgi:hypothetical protein
MGQSPLAKAWENASDESIAAYRAADIQGAPEQAAKMEAAKERMVSARDALDGRVFEYAVSKGLSEKDASAFVKNMPYDQKALMVGDTDFMQANAEYLTYQVPMSEAFLKMNKQNPWIEKVDPNSSVYSSFSGDLGFDHITDVLREDLATGRIRPEQLNKVSMEQAVRRTYEYDQELAAKANAARAAQREGLPVYKEYPEGYRWVELNRPGAFASESEAMGHSVRGYEPPRGHPDWVEGSGDRGSLGYGHGGWEAIKSGKAKVYSLVGPKGEPHVTVEVAATGMTPEQRQYKIGFLADQLQKEGKTPEDALRQAEKIYPEEHKEAITQIKGKQNQAPNQEYLPFVQDLVKSGQWAGVDDIQNTGLRNVSNWVNPDTAKEYEKFNLSVPKYATDEELDALHRQYEALSNPGDGMARGGRVHFSDNPDVMQLELAGGGLVRKGIKAIRGAAESAGQKAPVLAEKDLTTLQDAHTNLGDRVRAGAMEAQKMMEGFGYQYDKGQRVFTKDSAGKNKPPYTILNRTRVGNQVMREDHPEFGPGMGRPIIDPQTGKAMRTPYEPGYRVRMERGPDDWSEFEIPEKAIVGNVEMAAGGAVHMAAGGLARGLKALKPAKEAAVPLTLPRVRPTTQDIMEAAERVGKQQAGEFVRSPLTTKTSNLAGRSKKEVDRLKKLEYKVTPIKDLPEMKPYEAKVGEVNIALPGDQTISDMLLESVDGIPIGTTSEGGALFGRGRLSDPEETRAFWASNIGPADLFQKKVTEIAQLYDTDMVTAYHLAMGQMSNNFAQHMADASIRAIDYSKLNKDKMNAFDRIVSKGYVDPTTKERVTFENWPGIASPEDALQAMKEDPKLRKWFNNRMKTEKVTKPLDLPNAKSIEYAMTEPELRDMEINLTGLSAGRMKPGAELIPDSAHQTYSHDIPGTALGRAPELSPFAISFPDATAFVREKYRPQDFTGTIQKVFPHQVVDEAYLEDMYKYYTQLRKVRGYKKGGAVRKAAGGEITADDLILEERKL